MLSLVMNDVFNTLKVRLLHNIDGIGFQGIMKETSGLSSTSTSSFDSKSSMSGVKVNQCEMDGPAQEKGDMDEKPLDSSLMETLKYVDGAT